MKWIRWIAAAVASALAGVLLVQYLVAPPLTMSLYILLLLAALFGLLWLLASFFKGRALAGAAALSLLGLTAGYLISAYLFLGQEEPRALPPVQPQKGGHTAVIYLTHGEPPGYSPLPWIETFREFDKDGAEFIPAPFRPFFFQGLRTHYLETGGSPHNYIHQAMKNALEADLRREGDQNTRFYLSFLDSNPRPDEAAIQAINEGAEKLVISYVFLTKSSHTQAGAEHIESLDLPRYGVQVCETQPLWDSAALKQMFVTRANNALKNASGAVDKSKVGILLVGHGQPESWDALYPTQTSQEQQFRKDITELLVQDGFRRENISLAWMEFKQPEPGEIARELAGKGVEKILVFSAAISAPSLHSEYDVPAAVRNAGLPASVEVINLGAWGDDPLVIQAIREKLKDCGL